RYLLWGGYGYRTDAEVYASLAEELGIPVLKLHLADPDFYHLDTCLCPLDENTALIYPGAFDQEGLELIRSHFDIVLEAPEEEARNLFACNAHCPDGKHVLIQKGCDKANRQLHDAGFDVIELDTSEYLKSGGSVFCMKLMFW
ncbi:MAG: arginine deiminase-related protein, partial [Rubricoccaceae bacterium]|nr:arginine deiminase-related protein [Rubricoccaceae bacterium]